MAKVVKGVVIGAAIYFSGGAAAMLLPNALMTGAFLSSYFTVVGSLAMSHVLSGVAAQIAGKPKAARAETGVEYAGTVEPRRIIYGELLVAGMHTIPPLTSGNNNKYLHSVLTLAGHEVNDITDVYFGQDLIADADIGAISGASTDGVVGGSGAYAGKAWIRRYLGTPTDSSDYILNTAFTEWTDDHDGKGVAKVAVQLELDEEVYKTGRPECLFRVQGKKCYDPRLDTSPGANPTNASYIAYTTNPALCLADYLIDANLGLGDDASRIDWDMVEDAADICDELVDVPTAATQPRYTCNIALLATTPYENNIEALAACMLGTCLYSGGKWRIRAGAWSVPEFEITAGKIVNGGIVVSTAYPYKERWNGIRGTYVDSDNLYQPNEFPAVQDNDYVTDDGESVFKDTTFAGCTNVYEAQRNAMMLVRKSRNKRSAIVQCDLSLWKVRPGMTGIATIEELGWVNKTVRCESWGFNPAGTVELGIREELASDWDDPIEADYTEPLSITAPAQVYFTPSAPTSLAAVTARKAIHFSWTAPALVPTGSRYQLFEADSGDPFSSAVMVWEGFSTNCRLDKSDTVARDYWVWLITPDGVASPEEGPVEGVAAPNFEVATFNDAGPETINGGSGGTGDGYLTSFTFTPDYTGTAYISLNFTAECSATGAVSGFMPNVYMDVNTAASFSDNDMVEGLGVYAFSATAQMTGGVTYTIGLFAKVVTVGGDGNSITASNMRFIVNHLYD